MTTQYVLQAAAHYAVHLCLPMLDKEQERAIRDNPQPFLTEVSKEQFRIAMAAKARQERKEFEV